MQCYVGTNRRCFLSVVGFTAVLLLVLVCLQEGRPGWTSRGSVVQMFQTALQYTPPPFLCSTFYWQAGVLPDLSLTFTDHPSLTSYPASRAPQVNGHFLSEKDLGCMEGATDLKNVATAATSTITLLGSSSTFPLDSEIRVRVDVRTGSGVQKTTGGDQVRVWLRDSQNKANAAGYVVDLKNGSYLGVLRAAWVGQPEVVAKLAAPVEKLYLLYRLYATRGTLRELKWKYQDEKNKTHLRWCFPFDPSTVKTLPQTEEVCNFTLLAGGNEWYCWKPDNLTCLDQHGYSFVSAYGPLPLSAFEKSLLPLFHKPLKTTVKVNVTSATGESHVGATTPCHSRPWGGTFLDASPVGFFYRDAWHLRHCQLSSLASVLVPCLRNRTLYLFGDSTNRELLERLTALLHLKDPDPDNVIIREATNSTLNFTIKFFAHGMPFYGGMSLPVGTYLDQIPSHSNGLIFFTMYQHVTPYYPTVFRGRVRKVARAIARLLQRAPRVQVAIRGCHSYDHKIWDHVAAHDDYWGKWYDAVWKEELFHLRQRVVFIDMWDMTLGAENWNFHPPDNLKDALTQSLLSYTCSR